MCVWDEPRNVQERLIGLIPHFSLEATLFHPKWVCRNGTQYNQGQMDLIQFSVIWKIYIMMMDMIVFVVTD